MTCVQQLNCQVWFFSRHSFRPIYYSLMLIKLTWPFFVAVYLGTRYQAFQLACSFYRSVFVIAAERVLVERTQRFCDFQPKILWGFEDLKKTILFVFIVCNGDTVYSGHLWAALLPRLTGILIPIALDLHSTIMLKNLYFWPSIIPYVIIILKFLLF